MAAARRARTHGASRQLLDADHLRDDQRAQSRDRLPGQSKHPRPIRPTACARRSPPRLRTVATSLPPHRLAPPRRHARSFPTLNRLGLHAETPARFRVRLPQHERDRRLVCRPHPRTLRHQPARANERAQLPPPTCCARHLPRLRRWRQSAPLSCLPRRKAGEVARACARRRGQPQLSRTASSPSDACQFPPTHLAGPTCETAPACPLNSRSGNSTRLSRIHSTGPSGGLPCSLFI